MIAEATLCIALNVYFESAPLGKEPTEGKLAVAFVPRTRAERNRTSICWEVFSDMQFSWANDGRNLRALPSGGKWDDALAIAQAVLNGAPDITNGATHYHEKSKRPKWSRDPRMKRLGVWGSHIFYREEQRQFVIPAPGGTRG